MTEWPGGRDELLGALFKLLNTYARRYTVVNPLGESGYEISAAQAHVISLAVEDPDLNMSQMAANIGVTPASFSNTVTKLEAMGYLHRVHRNGNKKDVYVVVTEDGRRLHAAYVAQVTETPFTRIFELVDSIPEKHRGTFVDIMEELTAAYLGGGTSQSRNRDSRPDQ